MVSLMRAIDSVCSLQALWRQQLMLHVPTGAPWEAWGRWLVLEVCRAPSLYPRHPFTNLLFCKPPLAPTVSLLKFSIFDLVALCLWLALWTGYYHQDFFNQAQMKMSPVNIFVTFLKLHTFESGDRAWPDPHPWKWEDSTVCLILATFW